MAHANPPRPAPTTMTLIPVGSPMKGYPSALDILLDTRKAVAKNCWRTVKLWKHPRRWQRRLEWWQLWRVAGMTMHCNCRGCPGSASAVWRSPKFSGYPDAIMRDSSEATGTNSTEPMLMENPIEIAQIWRLWIRLKTCLNPYMIWIWPHPDPLKDLTLTYRRNNYTIARFPNLTWIPTRISTTTA